MTRSFFTPTAFQMPYIGWDGIGYQTRLATRNGVEYAPVIKKRFGEAFQMSCGVFLPLGRALMCRGVRNFFGE